MWISILDSKLKIEDSRKSFQLNQNRMKYNYIINVHQSGDHLELLN